MVTTGSELEQIFETFCHINQLPICQEGNIKFTQGSVYYLEYSGTKSETKLRYVDRVVSIDAYVHNGKNDLVYTLLTLYFDGQKKFLEDQSNGLATDIRNRILTFMTDDILSNRKVILTPVNDFSELTDFLKMHIDNY